MQLQGRSLELNQRGEDVKLLQTELRRLGFEIADVEGFFGSATLLAVQEFQRRRRIDPVTGIVDEMTARLINRAVDELDVGARVVLGQVRREDGSPVAGLMVQALDKEVRTESLVGRGVTDGQGHFQVTYTSDKRPLCLVLRAVDRTGAELATSEMLFDPDAVETVDLLVGESLRGPSEYTALERRLRPYLTDEGVAPSDVSADEARFLARKLGLPLEQVEAYVAAARLRRETRLRADAFYAFVRLNLPSRLPALLAQRPNVLEQALERAVALNLVPTDLEGEIGTLVDRLQELVVRHALTRPDADGRFSLNDLFETTRLSRRQRERLLTTYVRREGTVEEFWETLRRDSTFGEARVDEAQFALQLGAVTYNHLPLIREIRRDPEVGSMRDLVKFDETDWLALIRRVGADGSRVGTPPGIAGEDDVQREESYARIVGAIVEDAFPTAFVARRLDEDERIELPGKRDLVTFFNNNPDFGFERVDLGAYLREHTDGAYEGVVDESRLQKNLRDMKRLFAITPGHKRYEAMKPLIEAGVTSARAIERMGSGFLTRFSGAIGGDEARGVLSRAIHRSALAQTLFGVFSPALLYGSPAAVLAPNWFTSLSSGPVRSEIPDWESLFGSLTLCACEHCESVYSPAAYLVDILAFLKDHGVEGGLLADHRRADIARIELSCKNTNTPLPYIDLVNEILENAIAPMDEAYQTTWTAEELRAVPEHRNDLAYAQLAEAVYPWSLPFNLSREEVWRYLEHLGVPRYRLMELFQHAGGEPDAAAIAADQLGLAPVDRAIVTGAPLDPERTLLEFWGRPGEFDTVDALRSHVSSVAHFVKQTGLSYAEVLALISTRFVNPGAGIDIQFEAPDCNIATAHITPAPSAARLDAIHRFERLRRKLGWSFYELDRAIAALQPGEINSNLLVHLADLEQLRERLKAPLETLLCWWAPIDTADYEIDGEPASPSPYSRLFQNRALFDDEQVALFALNSAGTELVQAEEELRDHLPSIAAALQTNVDALRRIARGLSRRLNLRNLSALHRTVSLAKSLKLSVQDFRALRALCEINPFESPAQTLRFVDVVDKLAAVGLGVPELEYLFWHSERPGAKVAPSNGTTALVLSDVRDGLKKIEEEVTVGPDPDGELTRQNLVIAGPMLGWEEGDVDRAMALLHDTAIYTVALEELSEVAFPPQVKVAYDDSAGVLHFDGVMTQTERELLLELSTDEAYEVAIHSLFDQPRTFILVKLEMLIDSDAFISGFLDQVSAPEDRFAYVLPRLCAFLRQALSEGFLTQRLAAALQLEARTARTLLEILDSPSDSGLTAMESLLGLAEGDEAPSLEAVHEVFGDPFRTLTLLQKVAVILSKLAITADELDWLVGRTERLGLLDFNALPSRVPESEVLPSLFPGLERLIDLMQLQGDLSAGDPHLFDILEIALSFDSERDDAVETMQEFLSTLHQRTGWSLQDLHFLAGLEAQNDEEGGGEGLGLSFPDDYSGGRAVQRFLACFQAAERLGMSAIELAEWTKAELAADTARNVRSAAKSHYEHAQWLAVAQAINDDLRERQSDALVAHLITHRGFESVTHVYAHFLIDPEMSACMLTSRIVQASASVQLYVQRVLLNLEPDATLETAAAQEWEWMKQYRVWEANRKVFLYPENWIEPELRDDKSHLFQELESALLQGEVTEDAAKSALGTYLVGLNELARLEIASLYRDPEDDVVHVFGRTRGEPHRYFYRRRLKGGQWSAWEPVRPDIEGNHLIPFVKDRRFYLCWPIFTEKTGGQEKYWEMRLAWSEFKNGDWSAQKVSEAILSEPDKYRGGPLDTYHFRVIRKVIGGWGSGRSDGIFKSGAILTEPVIFVRQGLAPTLARRTMGAVRLLNDGTVQISRSYAEFEQEYGDAWSFEDEFGTYWPPLEVHAVFEPFPSRSPHSRYMAHVEVGNPVGPLQMPSAAVSSSTGNYDETSADYIEILGKTPGRYRIPYPHQVNRFVTQLPFFYEDDVHSFLVQPISLSINLTPGGAGVPGGLTFDLPGPLNHNVTPDDVDRVFPTYAALLQNAGFVRADDDAVSGESPAPGPHIEVPDVAAALPGSLQTQKKYRFYAHSHPHASKFLERLNQGGVGGLLGNLSAQSTGTPNFFSNRYDPNPAVVVGPYPENDVDFTFAGSYSLYNWELYFHAPLLIAERLRQNQRYAEALRWLHYIFNPMDTSTGETPQRFWKVRPFFEYDLSDPQSRPIQEMLEALSHGDGKLAGQVNEWRSNPFNPHAIARLRPIAYQKRVVMAYLDALIGWADQLFRRDTIESINEATQLYILAAEILGPPPAEIPPKVRPPSLTFEELEPQLDAFSNALIEIETTMPTGGGAAFADSLAWNVGGGPGGGSEGSPPPLPTTLYFCIPQNERLVGYWETVGDRLFKIRHCMNIEGVVRELPLFAPPIDPALLVQAAAAGLDPASALNDLDAPLPLYRFQPMLQKAVELCNDVKALGNALLSTLEKKDAEALALLRSGHEVDVLQAVRQARTGHVAEAAEALEALQRARGVIEAKREYYENIPQRIEEELQHLRQLEVARTAEEQGQQKELIASDISTYAPDVTIGLSGSPVPTPHFTASLGRANVIAYYQGRSREKSFDAAKHTSEAGLAAILASWARRADEWSFQAELAAKELEQSDRQIAAARIRLQVAERELESHDRQIDNAKEIDTFMRTKYTDQELYAWMISQISTVYFQSYQLAYDTAKRAEKAFHHELGTSGGSFIKFGYWDNLKKGLLAGEKLNLDLKRMDAAYLEQNRREYEMTKHVSLALLDPMALLSLRETGECFINLPEEIFDLDCPGQYMRRIKSVSLTIPCVTGPYTSVNCTLTLLGNRVRADSDATQNYAYTGLEDARFRHTTGAVQSIATSSGQQDNGLFDFQFRDERYLPFEGAGAISSWRLELTHAFRQFDYDTISDVVLHMRYTARDGGGALRARVEESLGERLNEMVLEDGRRGLFRAFEIDQEFPQEWHQLSRYGHTSLTVGEQHLPLFVRDHDPSVTSVTWLARPADVPDSLELSLDGEPFALNPDPSLEGLYVGESGPILLGSPFTLQVGGAGELERLVLLVRYTLASQ